MYQSVSFMLPIVSLIQQEGSVSSLRSPEYKIQLFAFALSLDLVSRSRSRSRFREIKRESLIELHLWRTSQEVLVRKWNILSACLALMMRRQNIKPKNFSNQTSLPGLWHQKCPQHYHQRYEIKLGSLTYPL